ncbi:MAG: glycosyltransferase family 4 protein [Nitrospirae bacterium]|nr:glycosyltransferase family 4 protein [Nitrospirota bacterium]
MKILQLIYESLNNPFGTGGGTIRAYEIYKRLKDRHDITLVCMKYPGARDGEIQGLRHVFVGTESKSLTKSVMAYTLKASEYVRRYGSNFDVIVENFIPMTPFFSKFLTKTPSILQVQGITGFHSFKKYNPLYSLPMYIVEKIYPLLYDKFIFVTDTGMDKLKKRSQKNAIIPNGIERELLHVNTEEVDDYILFLSRIDTYTKGLDILMDAFVSVSDIFKELKLILAGYEFNSIAELIKRVPEGLRERVSYAGFVLGEQKIKLLAGAKVFILPSRHEAHPVSILEALACGKAVIASDIPELGYIAENGIGLTFKSGSSQDLADKLSVLLEDKALRKQLGDKGRRYASQFLWDEIALMFERFLIEIHKFN